MEIELHCSINDFSSSEVIFHLSGSSLNLMLSLNSNLKLATTRIGIWVGMFTISVLKYSIDSNYTLAFLSTINVSRIHNKDTSMTSLIYTNVSGTYVVCT